MAVKFPEENSGKEGGEAGMGLKELREARGLSLDEVYRNTRISLVNLEALEKGEFHHLPPPVYTKGYLKDYAKLLDVEEKQLISRYEKYLASRDQADKEEADSFHESGRRFSKKFLVSASIVAFFCFLVFFICLYANFQATDVSVVDPVSVKVQGRPAEEMKNIPSAVKPEMNIQAKPEAVPEKQLVAVRTAEPSIPFKVPKEENKTASGSLAQTSITSANRLVIKAREETWLRIGEGNKKPYQILMKPGETIERFAPQFAVDVGNAAGISLDFQGKIMENLGKSGEVIHLRLP